MIEWVGYNGRGLWISRRNLKVAEEEEAGEVLMSWKAVAEEAEEEEVVVAVLSMRGLDGGHKPHLQSRLVVERLEEIVEEAQNCKK